MVSPRVSVVRLRERPFCILRCFCFFGCNIFYALFVFLSYLSVPKHVAFVYPNLDSDGSISIKRSRFAVINVRAKFLEQHSPERQPITSRYFRAVKPSGKFDFRAQRFFILLQKLKVSLQNAPVWKSFFNIKSYLLRRYGRRNLRAL